MHRLLEGEVGSGKTVVALYACLMAIEGGSQAAFMAPTEVLAEQHLLTVTELLDRAFGIQEGANLFAGVTRRPVVRLLTSSTPASRRAPPPPQAELKGPAGASCASPGALTAKGDCDVASPRPCSQRPCAPPSARPASRAFRPRGAPFARGGVVLDLGFQMLDLAQQEVGAV